MADREEFRAGKARETPPNFRRTNLDDDPVPKVELAWDQVTDSTVRSDYCASADSGLSVGDNRTAESGAEAKRITAHLRTAQGYKLHRSGTGAGFTPDGISEGQGNCLKDEGALPPMTTSYEDASVSPGQTLYYRVAAVVSE